MYIIHTALEVLHDRPCVLRVPLNSECWRSDLTSVRPCIC